MTERHGSAFSVTAFFGLMTTALAMGAALAHLLEMPNKIGMTQAAYFATQQAYRGWELLAILLAAELASMVAMAWLGRRSRMVLWPTLLAIACLAAAQGLFWAFTFPANQATHNWTAVPGDGADLRARWEYSHAGGAVLQVIAMACLSIAALRRRAAS